jgi:hypothetical protein
LNVYKPAPHNWINFGTAAAQLEELVVLEHIDRSEGIVFRNFNTFAQKVASYTENHSYHAAERIDDLVHNADLKHGDLRGLVLGRRHFHLHLDVTSKLLGGDLYIFRL